MDKILFKEEQKMRQWWLWLLILVSVCFSLYSIINPALFSEPNPSGNISISIVVPFEFWMLFVFIIAIILLLFFMKMTTEVSTEKLSVKHMYVVNKSFLWTEIESAEIIKYGFVGYGKRYSLKHGVVYNMSGNSGLAVTLKNGKKYLIGTQRPEELNKIVKSIKN